MDNDKTVRERLQDLEKDYEETRQAWNATDYLDKCFAALNCPGCGWGAFFPFLVSCVRADGGSFDPLHRIVEFPPAVTDNGFCPVPESELLKMFEA